jgi:hypothetical protein
VEYKASITGKKAGTTAATVSVSGLLSLIIVAKLDPFLRANGIEIAKDYLVVVVTAQLQAAYVTIANWLKHCKK